MTTYGLLIREWELLDIKELRTLILVVGHRQLFLRSNWTTFKQSSENLDLSKLEEFTIEANPGDLTVDKIEVLKKSAVNRVSLGVQTFDDKHLRQIGRSHNQAQIYESIDSLRLLVFIIFLLTSFMHYLVKLWIRSRKM